MIFFEPLGGLCNRLRSMASAVSLANRTEQNLWLLWRGDDTLHCDFDELFIRPPVVSRIIPLPGRAAIRVADVLVKWVSDRRWDQPDVLNGMLNGFDFCEVGNFRRPLLRTEVQFFSPADYSAFRPVPVLQTRIDRYVSESQGMIGIHLRRTDNQRAKQASPTGLFVEMMERELEASSSVRFFLATDDPWEESFLLTEFGSRVIIQPKRSRRRDVPTAIQDAIVDLYVLASCQRIYGSYWSSFSETAQRLGQAELHILSCQQGGRIRLGEDERSEPV